MKAEWVAYLRSTGFEDPLIGRAETILSFYESVVGIAPGAIFVSEYRDVEKRIYDGLWVFTDTVTGEAKGFHSADNFDLIRIGRNLSYWQISKTDFAFDGASKETSRVSISFQGAGAHGTLKASGANCIQLGEVFKTYLVPNLI